VEGCTFFAPMCGQWQTPAVMTEFAFTKPRLDLIGYLSTPMGGSTAMKQDKVATDRACKAPRCMCRVVSQ